MTEQLSAMGVDLGGTKVEVAQVDASGHLIQRVRRATDVKDGPGAIEAETLVAAGEPLQVLPAQLHGDAGVVGAAALAVRKQEVRV